MNGSLRLEGLLQGRLHMRLTGDQIGKSSAGSVDTESRHPRGYQVLSPFVCNSYKPSLALGCSVITS
jgi:hypothetical protein